MTRHLRPFVLASAVLIAPCHLPAQESMVRSDDGRAVLTLGAPAVNGAIRVIKLPDGDDVAGVSGSHYRVETSAASLPAGTRLAIRWDSAGLPGGVAAGTVTLMRLAGETWEYIGTRNPGENPYVSSITSGGEFAVRWVPAKPCDGTGYHAFDFRLGTWDYRAAGYTPGKSIVTRDSSGCALFDHYVDLQGGKSTSFFFFDQKTDRWYNTTIDPGGRSVSTAQLEPDGIAFYHSPVDREVYRRRAGGTIAFAAERSADSGRTWTAWATATYTRVQRP